MGLVSIERRKRDGVNLPNIYHLNMSGRVAAQEGDPAAQEGEGVAAQKGTEPSLSLTVNEPLDAQAPPPSKSTVRNELARVLDKDHVTAVIEHRRQIKKPLTPYGAKRLAAQLEKCRDGPDAAADFMIDAARAGLASKLNGWKMQTDNQIQPVQPAITPPADTWDSYGAVRFHRKTAMDQGENPFQIVCASRDDAEHALIEARRWLKPLPQQDLRQELVKLHVKTASAKSGAIDLELTLEVYLDGLQAYPGDVVRDVLRNYPGKFFPAFAELRQAITTDKRIAGRLQRIDALEDFLDGKPEQTPKPRPAPIGSETIMAMRRKYGFTSNNEAQALTDEQRESMARVDQKHGEKAIAQPPNEGVSVKLFHVKPFFPNNRKDAA